MRRDATLADLVEQYQETTGSSYAHLAERTGLTKSMIGRFGNRRRPLQVMPQRASIAAFAAGIGQPIEVVEAAAAASLRSVSALGAEAEEALAEIARLAASLSPASRQLLADLAAVLARRDYLESGGHSETP